MTTILLFLSVGVNCLAFLVLLYLLCQKQDGICWRAVDGAVFNTREEMLARNDAVAQAADSGC